MCVGAEPGEGGKTVRKRIKEMSRGKRLALYAAAIALLTPLVWALLGFPPLTKGMEFRWIMAGHCFPSKSPELVVEIKYEGRNGYKAGSYEKQRSVGFQADSDYVYVAKLGYGKEDGYHPVAWRVPAENGVLYTPLDWWVYDCMSWLKGEPEDTSMYSFRCSHIPAFAVKAPGAGASLTLILEDCHDQDGNPTAGGRFPLALDQAENGWFLFRWDTRDIAIQSGCYDESRYVEGTYYYYSTDLGFGYLHGQFSEPYIGLVEWLKNYDFTGLNSSATAYLELTTRDEVGNVLNQVTWKLP